MIRSSRLFLAPAAFVLAARLAGAQQAIDEEYTKKIKEYLQDPRITHRARRPPAGLEHGADAAQVPRPHRRHARRTRRTPRTSTATSRRSPRRRRAREVLDDRQDRGRARHGAARHRRRGDHHATSTSTRAMLHDAHRPAQDDRGAGAAAHQDGQADLLDHAAACTRRRPAAPRC